jgi:hypothetical protein
MEWVAALPWNQWQAWSGIRSPVGRIRIQVAISTARRHQDLLDLLELDRYPMWHYRRYGVEALRALGKKADAGEYAEASRGLNQPDAVIDQACEDILISSGLSEEAYQRYGLSTAVCNSYLARFRAVTKRYPMKDPSQILADLIATTPGEDGKWFATAKEIKRYDLAPELANQSPCDPKTLKRRQATTALPNRYLRLVPPWLPFGGWLRDGATR